MKAKSLLAAVVCINVLVCLSAALGDGGMFLRRASNKDILQPTQKVYIRWDGVQERLLIQTKYQGPAEEMVWIVPVPAEPNVAKGDAQVFETLSIQTSTPDISTTPLSGILIFPWVAGAAAGGGGASPVAWHRRIGEYDVILLRPVGAENVIDWLSGSGFAVTEKAVPILQDYIRSGWWMVAARIHPDALTDITRDKLADGLLHPLEMTFASPTCLYPLRLTSLAAGPVEELIYIEGPTHYEPVTFADPNWQIDVFGGPLRIVSDAYRTPDIANTMEIIAGRTITIPKRHLTKLRRVFQPHEMTQDILFGKMDYANLAARGQPLQSGPVATQYGRHRDPNGVPCLLRLLSPETLEEVRQRRAKRMLPETDYETYEELLLHVRSYIWALGEIAIEHRLDTAAEDILLQCAQHEEERVRIDAYIALTKLCSTRLGPILMDRFTEALSASSTYPAGDYPGYIYWDIPVVQAEINIVADWILRFGTAQQNDTIVENIKGLIPNTLGAPAQGFGPPERSTPVPFFNGIEWVIWRAACTHDPRLLDALENARSQATRWASDFLLRAEVACGSTEAKATLLRSILEDERAIAPQEQTTFAGNITFLNYDYRNSSLREKVLSKRDFPYELYPMSPEDSDAAIRSALATGNCGPWYTLYLLAEIEKPETMDKERLLAMWDGRDGPTSLLVVDVLYVWGDGQMLMDLYGQTQSAEARSEIAWALAELGVPQATAIVEERVRSAWNPLWIASRWAFPRLVQERGALGDPKEINAVRTAEAVWSYFHPEYVLQNNDLLNLSVLRPGILDEERLAALRRLAADYDIHPGTRFDLIGSDYAQKDWARPLLAEATAEVLRANPATSSISTILSAAGAEIVVDVCAASISDEARRSLLLNLLSSGDGYYLPTIEGLLWQVWPQRYLETQGQSILFREPESLAYAVDYYCAHCSTRWNPRKAEPVLIALVEDDSLPAGYRAFLLVYWPTAPGWFGPAFVERLLGEDMPDFIREALQKRLLNWQ